MKIAIIAFALTLLLGIIPAVAQSPETRTWLGGGAGVAAPLEEDGDVAPGLSLVLSHQRGTHVFSLRAAAAFELFGDDYLDVGLLYGRALSSGAVFASAGAGLGVVFANYGGGGSWSRKGEQVSTIGIPFEAQLFVRLLPFLGIGAYGFANVNRERRLLGATLGAQVGDLR